MRREIDDDWGPDHEIEDPHGGDRWLGDADVSDVGDDEIVCIQCERIELEELSHPTHGGHLCPRCVRMSRHSASCRACRKVYLFSYHAEECCDPAYQAGNVDGRLAST